MSDKDREDYRTRKATLTKARRHPVAKPAQAEKFKKAAKEAEADQDEAAFKKRLAKIAKPPKPVKK